MLPPTCLPSIIGLYVSVMMVVVAKFIQEHCLGMAYSITYDALPRVDHVLGLCVDALLVRVLGGLGLEQQLCQKLQPRGPTSAHLPPSAPDLVAGAPMGQGSNGLVLKPFGHRGSMAFGSPCHPPDAGMQAVPEPAAGSPLGPGPSGHLCATQG